MSSPTTLAQSPTIHPLAHILGSCAFTSVVAPFLQFIPTPSCNGIPPLSRCNKSPERGRAVRRNPAKYNHLHTHQGSPLVSISRASSRSLHRHPPVAQGHLHTFHPTELRSTPYREINTTTIHKSNDG